MLELKSISSLAGVEPLENHRFLYKKGGINNKIEDNQLHNKSGADGASLILVQKK